MKCTDCNGSGQYLGAGFGPIEVCRRCNGTKVEPNGQPQRFREASAKARGLFKEAADRAVARGKAIHSHLEGELKSGKTMGEAVRSLSNWETPDMTLLEPGTYNATVRQVTQRVSKTGRPIMVMDFAVEGYPESNVKRFLDPSTGYGVKEIVEATGTDRVQAMQGKTVQVNLDINGRGAGAFNVVRSIHPPKPERLGTLEQLDNWVENHPHVHGHAVDHRKHEVAILLVGGLSEVDVRRVKDDLVHIVPITVDVKVYTPQ